MLLAARVPEPDGGQAGLQRVVTSSWQLWLEGLDGPFQARDSTTRDDPHPPALQPSLLTHGLTGLSSLEVGHLKVVPPWGADQGQGWGA